MSVSRLMDKQNKHTMEYYLALKRNERDFPGVPVVKTPRSQCRGPGLDPWSGNWIPHAAAKTQHSQMNKYFKKKKKRNEIMIRTCYNMDEP